jgi:hypothetical protein
MTLRKIPTFQEVKNWVQDWVNNNADVPNADYADNAGRLGGTEAANLDVSHADTAGDADTLDGQNAAAFADSGHGHPVNDLDGVSGEGDGGGLDADQVDGLEGGEVPHYASKSDISVSAGQFAMADDTGALFFEDGTA